VAVAPTAGWRQPLHFVPGEKNTIMADKIKMLILEDRSSDAELNAREVKKVLPGSTFLFVETRNDFLTALTTSHPDIILSDYKLPSFDGMAALKLVLKHAPEVPFILVTGALSEETAVSFMKAGACDYVLKNNLRRIGPAVLSCLEQKRVRIERKRAEIALQESEIRYRTLIESASDGIYIADISGRFVEINALGCRMLGYSRDELLKLSITNIVSSEDKLRVATEISRLHAGEIVRSEWQFCCKDGSVFPGEVSATILPDGQLQSILRDITERKIAEEKLKTSLLEKETLLQELYHRTKNNMQMISALLELQSASIDDEKSQRILHDSELRIQTMAIAHEKLYKGKNLSRIDMKEYITDLTHLLMSGYNISKQHISLQFNIDDIHLLIDIAIPCGLIINELLSNCFKYAFPEGRNGQINIDLQRIDHNELQMLIADNGIGVPHTSDITKTTTLGIPLVLRIVKHQLQGSVKVETLNGLKWYIHFRDDLYAERV
jgi:PAS domain S-box-containing protein